MKRANITLKKEGKDQVVMEAMAPLTKGMPALNEGATEWNKRLVADLHTLHSVGVTSIEDMLSCHRDQVLKEDALPLLVGKKNVHHKHRAA